MQRLAGQGDLAIQRCLALTLLLMGFGLLMVFSASTVVSDHSYASPTHFVLRQALFALASVLLMILTLNISLSWWFRWTPWLLLLAFVALLLVLLPGLGHEVNGSRRWIRVAGLSFQVSEYAKMAYLLYLSRYIARYQASLADRVSCFINPLLVLAFMGLLLLAEPDFGSLAVLSFTMLMVLFCSRVRLWPFFSLAGLAAVGLVAVAILSPYRMARLTSFMHPWVHAFDSGYQLTQSLIAFGRGGLWGVGFGHGVQKMFYLPEAHTDFIFAVIAEELGLVGQLVVLLVFAALVTQIVLISLQASRRAAVFESIWCLAVALWIALQVLVNVGVNVGCLPTKGLTLPFISYGGSSLLINCLCVAIVCRVAYEQKKD